MRSPTALALTTTALLATVSLSHAQPVETPVATVNPTSLTIHDHVRTDDYFWLRERDNPDVVAYLNAENAYFDTEMAPLAGLRETLFEEIKGRVKQDDASVPFRLGDYRYYHRYEEGQQ